MVRRLRKLGGVWKAEKTACFGGYEYSGVYGGATWGIKAYSHLAPRYDGDDETCVTRWHIERNGKPWGYPTSDPVMQIGAGGATDTPARCTEACRTPADCVACGMRKAPRGRSVPMEAANGCCNHECPGYYLDPQPPHLWPSEEIDPKEVP